LEASAAAQASVSVDLEEPDEARLFRLSNGQVPLTQPRDLALLKDLFFHYDESSYMAFLLDPLRAQLEQNQTLVEVQQVFALLDPQWRSSEGQATLSSLASLCCEEALVRLEAKQSPGIFRGKGPFELCESQIVAHDLPASHRIQSQKEWWIHEPVVIPSGRKSSATTSRSAVRPASILRHEFLSIDVCGLSEDSPMDKAPARTQAATTTQGPDRVIVTHVLDIIDVTGVRRVQKQVFHPDYAPLAKAQLGWYFSQVDTWTSTVAEAGLVVHARLRTSLHARYVQSVISGWAHHSLDDVFAHQFHCEPRSKWIYDAALSSSPCGAPPPPASPPSGTASDLAAAAAAAAAAVVPTLGSMLVVRCAEEEATYQKLATKRIEGTPMRVDQWNRLAQLARMTRPLPAVGQRSENLRRLLLLTHPRSSNDRHLLMWMSHLFKEIYPPRFDDSGFEHQSMGAPCSPIVKEETPPATLSSSKNNKKKPDTDSRTPVAPHILYASADWKRSRRLCESRQHLRLPPGAQAIAQWRCFLEVDDTPQQSSTHSRMSSARAPAPSPPWSVTASPIGSRTPPPLHSVTRTLTPSPQASPQASLCMIEV
jgi:hypothetical protein